MVAPSYLAVSCRFLEPRVLQVLHVPRTCAKVEYQRVYARGFKFEKNTIADFVSAECHIFLLLTYMQQNFCNATPFFFYRGNCLGCLMPSYASTCVAKVPVKFRNLQLVHDSCSAAKLVLRQSGRGGYFLLHHFDLAAFRTWRYYRTHLFSAQTGFQISQL